ncbi:Conserved protein containing a Zn-ribbon-like motif, possibly RNA-binding [Epibacterium ulvae]|uniref:Conserved protein containing a Zn-ribbon-like motif, possibly RNA-binding n=1 Tax=Epibacterium ulvae TaxID=1156985 RepID=A0A1G5Q866_9RHOB|nr:ABATE domain-containing protein [Epibacterium ulvae]SCZ57581.1 Conserved protein containing a Zn-ribbon-like motif, possibly RNA-binding [Epibacterium ulvae]
MKNSSAPFQFVGNDLVLDFVNTRPVLDGVEHDLITTPQNLAQWLHESSAPPTSTHWNESDFMSALHLRDALSLVLAALAAQSVPPPQAVQDVNAYLVDFTLNIQLNHSEAGYHIQPIQTEMSPRAFLAFLAKQAIDLVTAQDANRVRKCADLSCVLMFKDTSKSGRRRWCSMETCGNRNKVAAFRSQSKQASGLA